MPGGYSHNIPETLKLIDLYYNSQFKTGKYDDLGFRKFFFNVVKPACDIATKFVDLDTKDIILTPESDQSEFKVWFLQKKLKQYLKNENFGTLLNEISFDYPKYGSVIIKKVKNTWEKVNIQNIRIHPSAKSVAKSPFVYELITMSRGEIENMKWEKDSVKELLNSSDDEDFVVYDCYARNGSKWERYITGNLFDRKTKEGTVRGTEADLNDESNDFIDGITLFEEEDAKLPYRELSWEKVPGRWLGFGFVEYLEENQVAINEAENLERAGLKFTSLKLYQSRDSDLKGANLLTGTQNGDILTPNSEITAVAMEERNLGAFNNTRNNWSTNTERKTFTSDITSGANLPSRTPLGVANLQASFATSYFELKRENYGLFIKELTLNDLLPDCVKQSAKEHTLTFSGSEADGDKLDKAVAEILVADATINYAEKHGFYPDKAQRDEAKTRILSELGKKQNRYYDIPKDFYKSAKYTVDVNITGESIDNGTRSQIVQLALQIVGQNPGVLQPNSPSRSLLFYLLSLGGISPAELNLTEDQPQQGQQPQVGGSLASPQAVQGLSQVSQTV